MLSPVPSPAFSRFLGGPRRVVGLDAARGLAVFGMFAAHVGYTTNDWSTGSGWLSLADGRSSILFAVIAGVSLSIVTGGPVPVTGVRAVQARTRLLVRAVMLLALAGLLDLLGTRVAIILGYYAAFFVLALPFMRWSPRRLAGASAVTAVAGPLICFWGREALARSDLHPPLDGTGALTTFVLTGSYPAVVWMAYVFAGMAIGRMNLTSIKLGLGLIIGGASLFGVFSWLSAVLTATAGGTEAINRALIHHAASRGALVSSGDPWPNLDYQWIDGPHTDTWAEVLASGGFALAALGLLLLLGQVIPRTLSPLAAVGSMALTIYTLQVIVIWVWGDAAFENTSNVPLAVMLVLTAAFATAWRWFLGRGALERLFATVAGRASTINPPDVAATASRPSPTTGDIAQTR